MLGLKDYFYLGIVVAVLAAFGWYTYHERAVQAAKDKAADQKLALTIQQRDDALTKAAAAQLTQVQATYDQAITAPPVAPPVVRLCQHAPSPRPVPEAAPGARDPGQPVDHGADTADDSPGPDIGPGLIEDGQIADARIAALKKEVADLRAMMNKSQ